MKTDSLQKAVRLAETTHRLSHRRDRRERREFWTG